MICFNCGTQLPDSANFCLNCGTKVANAAVANTPNAGGTFTDSRDGKSYRTIKIGDNGTWWSSSEYNSNKTCSRGMYYSDEGVIWRSSDKSDLFSVRCLKD